MKLTVYLVSTLILWASAPYARSARRAIGILVLALVPVPGVADLDLHGGLEYFRWREFDLDNARLLTEGGYRKVLRVHWTQPKAVGLLFGYRGKLYQGEVDYDGAYLDGTPLKTDTTYSGIASEGVLIFRRELGAGTLDTELSLGLDVWERAIYNPSLARDQREDYQIFYTRVGARLNAPPDRGWHGGAGLKLTLYNREDAHFTEDLPVDKNPALHPGRSTTVYADLGYRFSRAWGIVGYYDGYRFKRSDFVQLTSGGAVYPSAGSVWFQPKSELDVYGVSLIYSF